MSMSTGSVVTGVMLPQLPDMARSVGEGWGAWRPSLYLATPGIAACSGLLGCNMVWRNSCLVMREPPSRRAAKPRSKGFTDPETEHSILLPVRQAVRAEDPNPSKNRSHVKL